MFVLDDVILQGIENAKQVYNMYVSSNTILLEQEDYLCVSVGYKGYSNSWNENEFLVK